MKISINSTSRELVEQVEANPSLQDYFKTVELMRVGKISKLTEYLALSVGTKMGANLIFNIVTTCNAKVTSVINNVLDCYKTHLDNGRVFPYETYLVTMGIDDVGSRNILTQRERQLTKEKCGILRGLRFDTKEEIVESACVVYVILAAYYGWERLVPGPQTKHIPA